MALLEAQNLTKYFGGLAAVNRVDLAVEEGEIVGLIGPNGAGKTTCFNLLSGFLPPTAGTITFVGECLTGLKPHHIVARGLVRTFQHTTLFQDMTVLQNVMTACHLRTVDRSGACCSVGTVSHDEIRYCHKHGLHWSERACRSTREKPATWPSTHSRYRRPWRCASTLDVRRAGSGMNIDESQRIMALIKTIRDRGTTILLVEHNMRAVMGTCERIVVLNFGQKLAEVPPPSQ
jgi:branched-chain amino acid transport system ATP-binding protein